MPTFDTPEPITLTVELSVGDIRIVASDRRDTVVAVRPSDSARKGDVTAAEQTRVEYTDGRLLVKAPKVWRRYAPLGAKESIDVEIELPAGSQLRGDVAAGALRSAGRLGECHFKISAGDVYLAETGPAQLKTAAGDISVEHVVGDAELTTSSGAVRVDSIDGAATVKNSNGDTWIGDVAGDLHVSGANGKIVVDHARATVFAKTANGDVRIDEVTRGEVQVQTAKGRIDIGILDGTPAWLDLKTSFGHVRNSLDTTAQPVEGEDRVEVRARTAFGDITISRALAGTEGRQA